MKKLIVLGMAVVLLFSLTACGNRNKDNNTTGENVTTAPTASTTAGDTTTAGTTEEENSAAEPASDSSAAQAGTDELLTQIYESVKEAYGEDYVPDTLFDADYIEAVFGVTPDMYSAFIAEGPMISVNIDTFVGFKAQEGMEQDIYEAMMSYQDYLINDSMQYPTNAVKVQASRVVQHGEYVFFLCLGVIDMETEEQGDDAILAQAQEKNQIAVDVIDSFFTTER